MRRIVLATIAGLMFSTPLQVQASVTLEYLVLMTFVQDEKSQTIQFEIQDWSMGAGIITGAGPGGGPHLRHAVMTKEVGPASPSLFALRCSDADIQEVTVTQIIRDDEIPDEESYFLIRMKPAYISSYQTGGSAGDAIPIEQLSLNFEEIEVLFRRRLLSGEVLEEASCSANFVLGDGSVQFR